MNYGCEVSGNQATILKGPRGVNVGCDEYEKVALQPLIRDKKFYI